MLRESRGSSSDLCSPLVRCLGRTIVGRAITTRSLGGVAILRIYTTEEGLSRSSLIKLDDGDIIQNSKMFERDPISTVVGIERCCYIVDDLLPALALFSDRVA